MENKVTRLKIIGNIVSSCKNCNLHTTRVKSIFSRGNSDATIIIVGEAGGEEEHQQGKPFVGRSGKLLDFALVNLGVNVETDVYISNIVKCHPPNNRKPTDEECNNCIQYLRDEISVVNPKVIIALGNTSIHNLISTKFGVSKIRGIMFTYKNVFLMPTWHPSYVLRCGGIGGDVYDQFKQDLQLAVQKSKD